VQSGRGVRQLRLAPACARKHLVLGEERPRPLEFVAEALDAASAEARSAMSAASGGGHTRA
jgi:hypothetical protein